MKKLAIIVIATIAVVWLLGSLSQPGTARPEVAAKEEADTAKFAETVTARVKFSPKWSGVQVNEAAGNDYKLILLYKSSPSNQAEVARDTKAIAQAALTELMEQGRQPAQEHIFVTVWAHKPETGATGQTLTRVYGRSVYNYNNDSIEYKAK